MFGFEDHKGSEHQRLIRGGHSAAIKGPNHESLARFVLGLDDRPLPAEGIEIVDDVSPRIRLLSKLSWLCWLILLALAVALCFVLPFASGYPWLMPVFALGLWFILNFI